MKFEKLKKSVFEIVGRCCNVVVARHRVSGLYLVLVHNEDCWEVKSSHPVAGSALFNAEKYVIKH